jgi:nitrate/nitrite transport system substrate-binding protein
VVRLHIRVLKVAFMPIFDNPFDPDTSLNKPRCGCGLHQSQAEHDTATAAAAPPDGDSLIRQAVENAVVRAIFPRDQQRRAFLRAAGAATAMAAISQFFPLGRAMEAFAEDSPPEKQFLRIGFLPITCATPLIVAQPAGIYAKQGVTVDLVKAASWGAIRDKTEKQEFDAAHMLAPMPLAITLGLGTPPSRYAMPAMENTNGQALTLSLKHKDKRDPKTWKGFRFAVPFEYSMHNYLLRYYLAEHGLDPDKDVTISAVPPAQMVDKLRDGSLDGYMVAEPLNQRAVFDGVGFIHLLSSEIWDGHPCCGLAVKHEFVTSLPNTYRALLRSIIEATAFAADPGNRQSMASVMALPAFLNQPEKVVEQVLTGTYDDGLGNVKTAPGRIGFAPLPWESFAVWILTQMKRWGQIEGGVNYADIARQVYLATGAAQGMRELGMTPPPGKAISVMGKSFDAAKPEEYLASFSIRKVT